MIFSMCDNISPNICDTQSNSAPVRNVLLVINFPDLNETGSLTHRGAQKTGPSGTQNDSL